MKKVTKNKKEIIEYNGVDEDLSIGSIMIFFIVCLVFIAIHIFVFCNFSD